MATLHKIVMENPLDINLIQSLFIRKYCPKDGYLRGGGTYYVNKEVMLDLAVDCVKKSDEKDFDTIADLLGILNNQVKTNGLYEFYLED